MFKKRTITRREWYLGILTAFVLVAIVIAVAAEKTMMSFNTLHSEISAQEKKLVALKGILEGQKKLNEEYTRNVAGQEDMEDSGLVLKEIEAIARKTGVNIVNMKPSLLRDEGAYKTYDIVIESQDDVQHFSRFLFTLTDELKRIGVERLSILAQARNEPPLISLSLSALALTNEQEGVR
jgi:hypothetical protein